MFQEENKTKQNIYLKKEEENNIGVSLFVTAQRILYQEARSGFLFSSRFQQRSLPWLGAARL